MLTYTDVLRMCRQTTLTMPAEVSGLYPLEISLLVANCFHMKISSAQPLFLLVCLSVLSVCSVCRAICLCVAGLDVSLRSSACICLCV
jgi:hypothetical protein